MSNIINHGNERQFQKVTNFREQWRSTFDNDIALNTLTFNMEKINNTNSKRKHKPDISGNSTDTSKLKKFAADISPSSYLQILKGFQPVAPKPSTSEPLPRISAIYPSQSSDRIKLFQVEPSKSTSSTAGKILLPKLAHFDVCQSTAAPQNCNKNTFTKKRIKSKKLKHQEKQPSSSKNIESNDQLPDLSLIQHSKHNTIFTKDLNDVVNFDRQNENIQHNNRIRLEGTIASASSNNISLHTHDHVTTPEEEIIIKIEESPESEESMDETSMFDGLKLLKLSNQLLNIDVGKVDFKNNYCLKVTCQLLSKYPDLILNCTNNNNNGLLIIYPRAPLIMPENDSPFVDYLRILLKPDETYRFQVLHKDIQTGRFDYKAIKSVLEMMTSKSYKLCKGLQNLTQYQTFMTDVIKQSIRTWVCIERVDTRGCLLWYHASQRNWSSNESFNVCRKCKEVISALNSNKKHQIEQI